MVEWAGFSLSKHPVICSWEEFIRDRRAAGDRSNQSKGGKGTQHNASLGHSYPEFFCDIEGEEREKERASDSVDKRGAYNYPEFAWEIAINLLQAFIHGIDPIFRPASARSSRLRKACAWRVFPY